MRKVSIKGLKKKLWDLCRRITDLKYPSVCFTCGKPVEGMNKQLGHFIPSSVGGAALRFNLDNLRWQCYHCNINCGGNGAIFYRRMVETEGKKFVDKLFNIKNKETIKADEIWFLKKIEEYTEIEKELHRQ